MRVISQDGMTDIQYENFVFGITIDSCIVANRNLAASPQELLCGKMAEYSSKEKALKAMEMLREMYLKFSHATNDDSFYEFFDNPKVFRFPADDEVET